MKLVHYRNKFISKYTATILKCCAFLFYTISGVYDLSAMIDYVLWTTNQTKLAYVGHSQGVTAMLVLLSELPHYNEKISIFHAMTSPVILKYNHPLVPQTIEQVDMVAVSICA